ncbi:FMN-binding protein [Arthrobacter celericrescens]|uniref:FMN-binding protein n=1 Tax=Arthrobacter celericrescens TaxID=2320851 RepID=UPI000EA2FBC1|nr:FMN-binding protein [Arthrobacter celericrescens]
MTTPLRKGLLAGVAGLSLAGTVAACAPTTQTPTVQTPATQTPSSVPSASTSTSGASADPGTGGASGYKDGTYSADGHYESPNGTETVGVQLTLAGGTVTAVEITTHPTNPNTRKFQGEFKDGIAAQIVGKKLDELNVSKVSGSSLTSGGFNEAVKSIKDQAK